MSKLQKEERSNKIKGTSWLLDDTKLIDKENTTSQDKRRRIEQNMRSQNKKWKKNTNDRFQGYNKKIQQMVKSSFKEQNDGFSEFHYDSMRKADSSLSKIQKDSSRSSFLAKRKTYQSQMFQMRRKEREIQNQITKMQKLKEITGICQQKKNFYDGCVDRYFEDYKNDINKTINQIGTKLQRNSKKSFYGRPIIL